MVLGTKTVDRDAVLMANYVSHWDYFDSGTIWPEWRAVRTLTHTYVKWLDGKEELYDNGDDPYQMKNLAERREGRTHPQEAPRPADPTAGRSPRRVPAGDRLRRLVRRPTQPGEDRTGTSRTVGRALLAETPKRQQAGNISPNNARHT